ncbi:MAG: CBS domain-containing protein [Desulfonatronovibrio sp. MSAO_Bac4]|nr:MAG: CBS domain-containing protein [Desulfonatronovibrio sp. MSAO_Bac4]
MNKQMVKELMTPVSHFPRIRDDATFSQAAGALHKAQEDFASGRTKQRILLVENNEGKIRGKLSPLDLMRGLEPEYEKVMDAKKGGAFVANYEYVIKSMREQLAILERPLADICSKASTTRVGDFLRPVTDAQTIKAESSLNEALHRFIVGRFDSLFVLENGRLSGILRFSDVYREVYKIITEECGL